MTTTTITQGTKVTVCPVCWGTSPNTSIVLDHAPRIVRNRGTRRLPQPIEASRWGQTCTGSGTAPVIIAHIDRDLAEAAYRGNAKRGLVN